MGAIFIDPINQAHLVINLTKERGEVFRLSLPGEAIMFI
jgi:hypothetical protein